MVEWEGRAADTRHVPAGPRVRRPATPSSPTTISPSVRHGRAPAASDRRHLRGAGTSEDAGIDQHADGLTSMGLPGVASAGSGGPAEADPDRYPGPHAGAAPGTGGPRTR